MSADYQLAEGERYGLIALYNQMRSEGLPELTARHVREVIESRVKTINSMAAQLRKVESERDTLRAAVDFLAAQRGNLFSPMPGDRIALWNWFGNDGAEFADEALLGLIGKMMHPALPPHPGGARCVSRSGLMTCATK